MSTKTLNQATVNSFIRSDSFINHLIKFFERVAHPTHPAKRSYYCQIGDHIRLHSLLPHFF
uniref:Uncharacterized protein n=1 Tax=Arundo donax TaxID=35708 RepID=A0A0A9AWB8_ARUDO